MTSSSDEKQTVGFFDSGVGGLTVLNAFLEQAGSFSFHYLADTAHCPYGDRPLEEVKEYALAATNFLVSRGCQTVVMACNISSSIALEEARRRHPGVSVSGLVNENLGSVVNQQAANDKVGVLATSGTVKSNRYAEVLSAFGLQVIQQACSPLVPLVEAGELEGHAVKNTLDPLLAPLLEANVSAVVLGCTHYPFLLKPLKKLLPDSISIIDPGEVLAAYLAPRFSGNGDRRPGDFWATGSQESLHELIPHFSFEAPEQISEVSLPLTSLTT